MSATSTIKIKADSSDVQKTIKTTQLKAQQAAKQVADKQIAQAKRANIQRQQNIKAAQKGMDSIGKLGGSIGGVMKNVTGAFAGMLNPIGLITAALTAVIALGTKLWDMFTESAEEKAAKAKNVVQRTEKDLQKALAQQSTDKGYLERLLQIANAEKVSNAMKQEALAIIQRLTKQYGNLGLSIDMATGKIIGMDKAQDKLAKRMQVIAIDKANLAVKAQQNALAPMESNLTKGNRSFWQNYSTAQNAETSQTWNTIIDYSQQINKLSAKGKLTLDQEKQLYKLQVQRKLQYDLLAAQTKKLAAQKSQAAATTQKQIDQWKEYQLGLQDLIIKQKQLIALTDTGDSSQQDYIKKLGDISKRTQAQLQAIYSAKKRMLKLDEQIAAEQQKQININNEQLPINIVRDNLMQKRRKAVKARDKRDQALAKQQALQQQLARAEGAVRGKATPQQALKIAQLQEKVLKAKNKTLTAETQLKQLLLQQQQIETNLTQLQHDREKSINDKVNAYKLEIAYIEAIRKGLYQQVEAEKILQQYKNKKTPLTNQEINKIMQSRNALQGAKLKQSFIDQLKNMAGGLDNSFNSRLNQRIQQIQKNYGISLNKNQISQVSDIMKLQDRLNKLQKTSYNFGDIKTNELTARGGMRWAAQAMSKGDINRQIFNQSQKQTAVLTDIKTAVKNLGVVVP